MELSPAQLKAKLDDPSARFFLVDVLLPEAYSKMHVPGAINLPVAQVRDRATALLPDKKAEIVTYCGSSH